MSILSLPMLALAFPNIDPIAFSIGSVSVHWYGIAYVVGILLGWSYAKRITANNSLWPLNQSPITKEHLDDFIFWAALGIILGGRLGYIFFYDLDEVLANPMRALEVWKGGMSFHGGLAGTTVAMILYARRNAIPLWSMFDIIAVVAPVGLFFGRIANFINQELWGKITSGPWGVYFPNSAPFARHPSQLYEAALEGLLLLIILAILVFKGKALKRPGLVTGVFVAGYALSRILVEFVREPDVQLGYLFGGWLTMGMVLSLPLLLLGLWAMLRARRIDDPV